MRGRSAWVWVLGGLAVLAGCASEAGPQCPAGAFACGSQCVDVTTSRLHCGACGNACGGDSVCVSGRCVAQCPSGQARCGEACVDLQQDARNCGRCGNACTQGRVCVGGACDLDCGTLTTCADLGPGGAKTLYCANLSLDRLNCGACGATCPAGQVCRGGRCEVTCPLGQLQCGGRCVDPQTDRLNCGGCGAVCAGGFECARGRCVVGGCPAGTSLCAGSCVDLQRDRNHCGACLAQCPSGYLCSGAECRFACAPGESMCGTGCADLMNDARNCGMCGRACAFGELCRAGACTTVCQPGQTLCAGRCTDVSRDRAHCGACGRACAGAEGCVDGACRAVCGDGQQRCGSYCIDVRSDPANCGMCGRACAAAEACAEGVCRAVGTVPTTGPCASPSATCGGRCVDLRSDNNHCGACGRACAGDQLCFNGACVLPCGASETRCPSGQCSALRFDEANCGACGRACAAGQSCVRGVCGAASAPTRYEALRDAPQVRYIDACSVPGAERLFADSDEGERVVMLPFPMRYWTLDLPAGSPALVSVNGFLAFTGATTGSRSVSIASTSAPNAVVAVHSRDIQNNSPLCVATLGVAPLRRWVVEWSGAQDRASSVTPPTTPRDSVQFEVIFSEGSDTIDFVYRRMDGALTGYHGLENPSGTAFVSACATSSTTAFCAPSANTTLRFNPVP